MHVDNELNPLTLGDTPEEYIENDDGSVDIPELEAVDADDGDFLVNLATILDDDVVADLGAELVELVEQDKESRKKRDKQYEEGLRRTGLGDDAPGGAEFDGASRVVHPVLAEACVDFSSRAIKELFPAAGPVKPWVNGDVTAKKLERANRKTRFMNWQLTTQIKEYRDELEQLLTQLPMGGSQYQKFWRDAKKKRICCEFVAVDEIYLPFAATSFYNASRITHSQLVSRATFERRIKSGLYRDVFVSDSRSLPDSSAAQQANDKIEGRADSGYNEDGLRAILEIYCWQEIPGDTRSEGEYAPYIITIDEDTEEVLSIYRNWAENDPTLEKLEWLVEWKFIPWRGAYAIGLPHLIGGISAALTGSLRALLDSAHINNAATMLKLKSGRIVGQNTQVSVTQVHDIEGPAGVDDIRKLAMPMPFNPPSPVLAQLMQDLYGLAKGVVATAEEKIGQVGDRTPVGTTMALIEQGSNTYSAIHARLHESQKRALAIIHRLNAEYLEDDTHVEALGEMIIDRADFEGTLDVIPVSDPTIFSEAQRFAQSQAIMQMALQDAQNPKVPWNQVNVRRRMLKQMRIEGIDELLPAEREEITGDVLTENTQGLLGSPIKAAKEQDHMSHIRGHLSFLESPMQLANPLIPGQVLMGLLTHINEHIQMLLAQQTATLAQQMIGGTPMYGAEDQIFAEATKQANVQMTQQFASILEQLGKLQAQIQQKMPKPQLPPEVQASLQIAQMDTQRKTQYDQGMLQMKQQELQARSQQDMTKMQIEQAKEQFNQQTQAQRAQFEQSIAQMKSDREAEADRMRGQVELMKNEQDNHRAKMVDLLKNRDDNETKILIEQMKGQLNSMSENMSKPAQVAAQQIDLTPQLEQLNRTLDQLGKQQTNDALVEVMNGLRATVEHLGRPKMLIKDQQGKTLGIQ